MCLSTFIKLYIHVSLFKLKLGHMLSQHIIHYEQALYHPRIEKVILKIAALQSMYEFTTITINVNICPLNIYSVANISVL